MMFHDSDVEKYFEKAVVDLWLDDWSKRRHDVGIIHGCIAGVGADRDVRPPP